MKSMLVVVALACLFALASSVRIQTETQASLSAAQKVEVALPVFLLESGARCVNCGDSNAVCVENCQNQVVDCVLGEWKNDWSACTALCGGGVQEDSRPVLKAPVNGGASCGQTTRSRDCNTQSCDADCVVTGYGTWGECSATCGGGVQFRKREITSFQKGNGVACPSTLVEFQQCKTQACESEPVCNNEWKELYPCPALCGGATMVLSREGCGYPDRQPYACASTPCPVDCEVSNWSSWSSSCSASCGQDGVKTRTRKIVQEAANNGASCNGVSLYQTKSCNRFECPRDCQMYDWGMWSSCSAECKPTADAYVYKQRTRNVKITPIGSGAACSATVETKACDSSDGVNLCPVNCEQSAWTIWTGCTAECGGGEKTRTRTTTREAANGGRACGVTSETVSCNQDQCAINCEVSGWGVWSECSAKCGGGDQRRTRSVRVARVAGGMSCPSLTETRVCGSELCPADCKLSEWSEWSNCSKECVQEGSLPGRQTRSRKITSGPLAGGQDCGCLAEERDCNVKFCPIDCRVTQFSDWSECSAPCYENGQAVPSRTRSRKILELPAFGGKSCPALVETEECNKGTPCPHDCVVGTWGEWKGTCPACYPAGSSPPSRTRTRSVVNPTGAGLKCPPATETEVCNIPICKQDCEVNTWSEWSPCTAECGDGTKERTRSIKTAANYGGNDCPILKQCVRCKVKECPVDCKMSGWGEWSACSKSCTDDNGAGSFTRTRSILQGDKHNGAGCGVTVETYTCNTNPCPKDCVLEAWTEWGACSSSCAGGYQTRTRAVKTYGNAYGKFCEHLSEMQQCNTHICPRDCVLSGWGPWSPCSQSCSADGKAFGSKSRSRSVLVSSINSDKVCDNTIEKVDCGSELCPQDCEVGAWSFYGECSAKCGQGRIQRKRIVVRPSVGTGAECPPLDEWVVCPGLKPCPVPCNMSQWTHWSECDKSCGRGTQYRERTVLQDANHGASMCEATIERQECAVESCPIDCVVSEWGVWGQCNRDGVRRRTRNVLVNPAFGGKVCPECLTEKDKCTPPANEKECEVQPCDEEANRPEYVA